jgi:predicted Ser/Thr protein kinase
MNDPVSSTQNCGRCGIKLPANAPEGLCPRCLGALNLSGETVFTETETPPAPAPSPEEIRAHFPQLEILECLGRGGMGVVYKARQKSLGRFVALKLLAPEREKDPQFAERFAREAQALAQLSHPHIVIVHDFGQTNGYFYLLMEFVDGVNLRQLLRARKLTPREALAIVPPLCEALQFAHDRGIVHRDIKPENLLLDKAGQVKVADFGIAKMLGSETPAEEENIAGTPGYMAPEQHATPPQADSRADIYSLGVVFYEMLTGELPGQKFQPPSRKVAVDVRIDEVVLRALEKSPGMRWQTAAELGTRVENIAAAPTAREWHPRRQRAFWFLALPIAVALLVVNFVLLNLYAPPMTAVHSHGFGATWGVPLLIANALALCAALDGAVLRALWEWAHTAPAQATRIWRATRLWWAAAACCLLLPWLLLPVAPRIVFFTELAPPVSVEPVKPVEPPPTTVGPSDRVPVLGDLPILGSLFTKPGPNEARLRVEAAEIDLQAAELRLENERKNLQRASEFRKQKSISEADYDQAAFAFGIAETDHKKAVLELRRAQAVFRAAQVGTSEGEAEAGRH